MTAFFTPGISGDDDGRALELAYGDMRARVELEMGRRPAGREIEKLWMRRGSIDCLTVVGEPDPLLDGTGMTIFDMGWTAYSVLEFDP
jgi:hypothetical protein